MRLLSVNGSPKAANSASAAILDRLEAPFGPDWDKKRIKAMSAMARGGVEPEDLDADLLLVVFPLYVDGLPTPLLQWLMWYRDAIAARRKSEPGWRPLARVCAVSNCGFHEGRQNEHALRIVRSFASSCGLVFGGGLGLGCGGMLRILDKVPDRARIKRPVAEALGWIGDLLSGGESPGELRYAQFAFPRMLYLLSAHSGWRSQARAHGLDPGMLRNRPGM